MEERALYRRMGTWASTLPRSLLDSDVLPPTSVATSPFSPPPPSAPKSSLAPFKPSIAIIVGILTTMFSITFLLLLYAKHCKRSNNNTNANYYSGGPASSSTAAAPRRHSGVDRTVVESLPLFRFGVLRGQKAEEGSLECAVCLARFDGAELLRLLPKCKHAFHVECVDTWLDAHSTCPLCRSRVDPEDIFLLPTAAATTTTTTTTDTTADGEGKEAMAAASPPPSEKPDSPPTANSGCGGFIRAGARLSGRHSSAGEKSTLQVVVQTAVPPAVVRRASVDDGLLRDAPPPTTRKDGLLPTTADMKEMEKRFGHQIIVSSAKDVADRNGGGEPERWSELRQSEFLFLRSEMMIRKDGGRHSAALSARRSSSARAGIGTRSASEITGVSRRPPAEVERQRTALRRWRGFAAATRSGR